MTPPAKNDSLFWKKKEFVSFLLSILVFFIHSNFAQDSYGTDLISVVNQKTSFFFSRSITQFAVPMFFMLSAVAFFKGYDNKKYPAKIKSRIFTLVIPYLLWNTIWLLWEIFCSYSFVATIIQPGDRYPLTLISILKGIFFYGCNVPFWFIFDLIIFSFAAPLVFIIIRNRYVGIGAVVALSVLSVFGIHLPESVFYYPTAIIFYLTGAIIGYHYFDLVSGKSSKPTQFISVAFLAVYVLAKNIVPQRLHIDNYLAEVIVFTLASCSLWNITDIFIDKIRPRAIYRRSFAIYAMHLNVAMIILKIFSLLLPDTEWLKFPKFVFMVALTLIAINLFCIFTEKFLPGVNATLMGKRLKKQEKDN